jgi:hypothetical protein
VARVDAGAGGLLRHRDRNRLLSGADAVFLQVRLALMKDSPTSNQSSIGTSVAPPASSMIVFG